HSARSCTVICGTDSTGNPPLFHSIIPQCKYPTTSSTPTRESACTARSRSDGPCARSSSGTPAGTAHATRSANCGLSIQTLSAPGRRARAVGRVDLEAVVERQEHARQALVRLLGRAGTAEVRAPHGPDEERVAGEDEPRLGAPVEVRDEKTDRVGRVARRVRDLQSDVPDAELVAVAEPLMIEGEASGPVSEDRRVRR